MTRRSAKEVAARLRARRETEGKRLLSPSRTYDYVVPVWAVFQWRYEQEHQINLSDRGALEWAIGVLCGFYWMSKLGHTIPDRASWPARYARVNATMVWLFRKPDDAKDDQP